VVGQEGPPVVLEPVQDQVAMARRDREAGQLSPHGHFELFQAIPRAQLGIEVGGRPGIACVVADETLQIGIHAAPRHVRVALVEGPQDRRLVLPDAPPEPRAVLEEGPGAVASSKLPTASSPDA